MKTSFTFYLDWIVCAQFAGIFWAKEHGFYEAKGIHVNVVPWEDDGRSVIDKVLESASSGELSAGCAEDNLLVRRCADDGSVKVFGAMLQDTPLVLMSRPTQFIRSLADLRGKRVGMHTDGIRALEMVLALEGIPVGELDLHEVGFDLEHLRSNRFDALQGYTMTEPVQLSASGIEVDILPVRHRRLKPFAQTYFSAAALLSSRRAVFADFLAASSDGWSAACTRPEEAAALISRLMGPIVGAEDERTARDGHPHVEGDHRRSLDRLIPLVVGDLPADEIGSIDVEQWKRNLTTYFEFGLIRRNLGIEDVVCELGNRSV